MDYQIILGDCELKLKELDELYKGKLTKKAKQNKEYIELNKDNIFLNLKMFEKIFKPNINLLFKKNIYNKHIS